MSATERLATKVVAAALAVVTVSAVVLVSGVGGPGLQTAYTDLVQLAAAAAAACTAAAAVRRTTGRARLSWAALSAASASWAVGEMIWTWYEPVLGEATPFPSFADIGFLVYPLVAAVGLWLLEVTLARSASCGRTSRAASGARCRSASTRTSRT